MITSVRRSKHLLASALERTGLLRLDLVTRGSDGVIAVNYHGTPRELGACLERHLAFYAGCFECLDESGLQAFLRGSYRPRRPGLVISFDDGLKNHAEVAAPLLERHGLRGWFMVPGAFVDEPRAAQARFFWTHIRQSRNREHPGDEGALALAWEDLQELSARGHVVGCHTWSHCPLPPSTTAEAVERETIEARQRMEEKIGRPVRTFCWVRGRVGDYCASAQEAVGRAYQLAFTTTSAAIRLKTHPLMLHRFNVEASFPLPVVRFQISRFNEMAFWRRRRAVRRILGAKKARHA